MCQLIGLFGKIRLRCKFYLCCGIHFLMGSLLSITFHEAVMVWFGLIELYMIGLALIGIRTNTPILLSIMLCYQIVTAMSVSIILMAALVHEQLVPFLCCFALLTFEIYFLYITVKLYPEIKTKIGHVVSPPEITEGSNCTPNVIIHPPQATQVPSISNLVFHPQPNTVVQAEIPHHNCSYPPDYIQPAFNTAFVSSSNFISHN